MALHNTKLGWILTGRFKSSTTTRPVLSCHLSIEERLDGRLQRFWETEQLHTIYNLLSSSELECEEHFEDTVSRDNEGRFVVCLPTKGIEELGTSRDAAFRRLVAQERRWVRNPSLREQYAAFMRAYLELGHMEPVLSSGDEQHKGVFYLPHHAVLNEMSLTTKLRVVFDGSCKTASGVSLNDCLLVGPVVQDELFNILLRFRKHQFVITADIEKMYRQIRVHPDDRDVQRILWREDPSEPVKEFRLSTVTYGTSSAPYLATRCLKQLAINEKKKFPRASEVIEADFYVDDLVTGGNTVCEVKNIQADVTSILSSAGFHLRKWCSNDKRILEDIPASETNQYEPENVKMLGIKWDFLKDVFMFAIKLHADNSITRRSALSQIAAPFDPLGLVGPVVLKAKIFMQRLWELKIGWDDQLPDHFQKLWKSFLNELSTIELLRIERKIFPVAPREIQIHGFCDASTLAYGACIYVRSTTAECETTVRLICAKSRVAPIKAVSLPRLELCAALLLAQLVKKVLSALKLELTPKIILWSDSTVVLSWITSCSSQWKTFVANRVAQIHELSSTCEWRHVSGDENPADHISRGLMPSQIGEQTLWWNGPEWLAQDKSKWPARCYQNGTELEIKKKVLVMTAIEQCDLWTRYSERVRLQRITALVRRFIKNCKSPKGTRLDGYVTVVELNAALETLIRRAQSERFEKELLSLQRGSPVHKKSCLKTLHPFLDNKNIIRVGGRLINSKVDYEQKHPIVLPSKHHLTNMIMQDEHVRLLNAGQQLLLPSVRTKFWPLNGKNTAKKVIHQCITCFKVNPKSHDQLMGYLPKERVQPARPFLNTGVDYCGPISVRSSHRRGFAPVKNNISIFVCLATKAVHIELVSALTTEAFLGALKRFMSRRGKCAHIFSDNATNFTGAKNELQFLKDLFLSKEHQESVGKWLAIDSIQWHFIPPRSPHFGGLWEAGVKSLKHHLRRTVGNAIFTYEELYTILTLIEACLNSRPLTPISNDLLPLTPSHFLIGDVITATVEPDLQEVPMNRLSRWQLVQQQLQGFWSRWSNEYLSSLQQRLKWQHPSVKPTIGDLVIIKDKNLPPMKWKLGRIIELHPGKDGLIRVISVKTAGGVFKRAVNQVCPLPTE